MPADFTITIRGLDEFLAKLDRLQMQIDPALERASRKLAKDALKLWRGAVTRRSGRMRQSLSFAVRRTSRGIEVAYFVGRRGFYYAFQPDARKWTSQIETFLRANGKAYVLREFRTLLG